MKILEKHETLEEFQESITATLVKTRTMTDLKLKERLEELLLSARSHVQFVTIYVIEDEQTIITNIQRGLRDLLS